MKEIIENFKKETGYELTIKDGKLFYDGNLNQFLYYRVT